MKIFGWAADRDGCGYYRIGLPMHWLSETYEHIDARASTIMPPEVAEETDIIVGQRVSNPGPSTVWQRNAELGKRMVYEMDDDFWTISEHNEISYDYYNQVGVKEQITKNIRVATAVTVSTETLATVIDDLVADLGDSKPEIFVVPNGVDEALLTYERPRRDRLTVGWSGSATHKPDFMGVREPLTRYFKKYPNVDIHFMGTDYRQYIGRREALFTGWVPDVSAYHSLIDFDIGVIPLAHNVFNRSKSPIKALEYGALGIPVVASNFGPYSDFVIHGETGFLARYDHEWLKYLRILTEDEDMRIEMGKKAREHAASYTIQKIVPQWRAAFESLMQ